MKIHFVCGCGLENYSWNDWIAHFKYRGWRSGMKNLLKTRITLNYVRRSNFDTKDQSK